MNTENHDHDTKPLDKLFLILSKKWTLKIIYAMFHQKDMRFSDFEKVLANINTKTLSQRLTDLEKEEFITRTVSDSKPIQIKYNLTDKSLDLQDAFMALGVWSNKWA